MCSANITLAAVSARLGLWAHYWDPVSKRISIYVASDTFHVLCLWKHLKASNNHVNRRKQEGSWAELSHAKPGDLGWYGLGGISKRKKKWRHVRFLLFWSLIKKKKVGLWCRNDGYVISSEQSQMVEFKIYLAKLKWVLKWPFFVSFFPNPELLLVKLLRKFTCCCNITDSLLKMLF